MQRYVLMLLIALASVGIWSCADDKLPLPVIPPADEQFRSLDDAEYVQLNRVLDASNGYDFNRPSDIYVGVDNFLYVADTGNDRIVMLDAGGDIQGISQQIPRPAAITQNDSLQLLVVNKTNQVFRIDLLQVAHNISAAPVDVVFTQGSEPSRQFTGISVHGGFEYYVTVIDTADSSSNFREFSFIYDFRGNHTLKGPLPLNVNGSGLFAAILPTAIVSERERWLDISPTREVTPAFYFVQTAQTSLLRNNFPFQRVGTVIREGDEMIVPDAGYLGSDIYQFGRYYRLEDMAIDRSGFIFILEAGRLPNDPNTLRPAPAFYRFSANSGKLQQEVIGLGNGKGQFNDPRGIAVLPFAEDQIVFVADTGNNRVLMFQLSTDL